MGFQCVPEKKERGWGTTQNILQTSCQGYCGPHSEELLVAQTGMFNCKLKRLNNNCAVAHGHLFDGPNQPHLSTLLMCSDNMHCVLTPPSLILSVPVLFCCSAAVSLLWFSHFLLHAFSWKASVN